ATALSTCWCKTEQGRRTRRATDSGRQAAECRGARHPLPGIEGLGTRGALGCGSAVVAAMHEQVGHLVVHRGTALHLSSELESVHHLYWPRLDLTRGLD